MKCPNCGYKVIRTINTRHSKHRIRRRRICVRCEKRFTTYEEIYIDGDVFDDDIAKSEPFKHREENTNASLRFKILKRDKFTCQCCGRKVPDVVLHVDHKVSVKNGGKTISDNLWVLCKDCN